MFNRFYPCPSTVTENQHKPVCRMNVVRHVPYKTNEIDFSGKRLIRSRQNRSFFLRDSGNTHFRISPEYDVFTKKKPGTRLTVFDRVYLRQCLQHKHSVI